MFQPSSLFLCCYFNFSILHEKIYSNIHTYSSRSLFKFQHFNSQTLFIHSRHFSNFLNISASLEFFIFTFLFIVYSIVGLLIISKFRCNLFQWQKIDVLSNNQEPWQKKMSPNRTSFDCTFSNECFELK